MDTWGETSDLLGRETDWRAAGNRMEQDKEAGPPPGQICGARKLVML